MTDLLAPTPEVPPYFTEIRLTVTADTLAFGELSPILDVTRPVFHRVTVTWENAGVMASGPFGEFGLVVQIGGYVLSGLFGAMGKEIFPALRKALGQVYTHVRDGLDRPYEPVRLDIEIEGRVIMFQLKKGLPSEDVEVAIERLREYMLSTSGDPSEMFISLGDKRYFRMRLTDDIQWVPDEMG